MLLVSGPPKPFAAVSQLPAALRLPQQKHAPGLLEHVSGGFCHFLTISGPPSPLRLCRSCLLRFGSLRKNTPLDCMTIFGCNIGNFIENWTSFTEKCVKCMKPSTKNSFGEFASGATRAPGSGVSKCCSDPPFHTRRGSG